MTNARLFWLALIVMGAGTSAVGSALQRRADQARALDDLSDGAGGLLGLAESTGLDMTGAGIVALGGLILIMGLIGLARSFRSEKAEDEPGLTLPTGAALGVAAEGDAPSDEELLRRLMMPTLGGTGAPRKDDAETFPPHRPLVARRPPQPPRTASASADPTTWPHPEGFLFVFEGRDSVPFFELVRDLRRRHLPNRALLVARLQSIDTPRRTMVAVLGEAGPVEQFDSIYRQFAGLEFGVRGIDPSHARPHATLQARSYDPAWVVPNPEPFRAEREAIRRGGWVVRDLDAAAGS